MTRYWLFVLMLLLAIPITAQETTSEDRRTETADASLIALPEAQAVDVRADDRLQLKADFYLQHTDHPTVILLHQLYATRASWDILLPSLLENGYNVLVVDVRGHGATRGVINWQLAIDDVQIWFDWLRQEAGVQPNRIMTMGSSMGATLAIVACANDALCTTSVAISPGWDYYNISVADAIAVKPTLALYAERDRYPSLGIPKMVDAAPNSLTVQSYTGNAHGMDLVRIAFSIVEPTILEWLATHNG